jgi:LCP family protein required for cell wall assembly
MSGSLSLDLPPASPSLSSPRVFLRRVILALVFTSLAGALGLAGGAIVLEHKFAKAKQLTLRLDEVLPGSMNFLLLGSDSRAFVADDADQASFGGTGDVGGQRADVIIIARVDLEARRGVLVSIPRDLLVRLPKYKDQRRINESFEEGPQGVVDAIKSNFGVPINHYLQIDFSGFRAMIDVLGGVRMDVPAPAEDKMTGLDIKTAGCMTLDGAQGLAWVRSRHYTYYEAGKWRTDPTGDIGRITRQQDFIRRLMAQAVQKGALNPLRANRLAEAALANTKVDNAFDVRDALRLAQAFRPVGAAGVEMVALPTRPVGATLATTSESEAVLARLRGQGPSPSRDDAARGPTPTGSETAASASTTPKPSGVLPRPAC